MIAGPLAQWDIAAEDVQEVIDAADWGVRLVYVEADGAVLIWGRGDARAD